MKNGNGEGIERRVEVLYYIITLLFMLINEMIDDLISRWIV